MGNAGDTLLTVSQAADQLGIKPSTVRAWILQRRIGSVKIGRRSVRIPATEISNLIDSGFRPARPR
jgi:excisionase family DNA binding protein